MVRRLFTPLQANKTLPLVRRIVDDILVCGRALQALAENAEAGADRTSRIDELRARVLGLIEELEDLGCSYKDWGFEIGLVDFPSKIGGRRVLLCWRSDEPQVTYYHGYDEGFAGRRSIPAHLFGESLGQPTASDAQV